MPASVDLIAKGQHFGSQVLFGLTISFIEVRTQQHNPHVKSTAQRL